MDRALKLDPLSLIINTERGQALYLARRYGEAETQLTEALALDEDFAPAHSVLALVYLQTQMYEHALAARRGSTGIGEGQSDRPSLSWLSSCGGR